MRLVVQRVTSASVEVDGEIVGAIDRPGLLILAGVTHDDQAATVDRLAEKVWTLRILDGERSCQEENAPILVVSQFTLYADTRKGRRPSWSAAAPRAVSRTIGRGIRLVVAPARCGGRDWCIRRVHGSHADQRRAGNAHSRFVTPVSCHLRHGFGLLGRGGGENSGLTEADLRDQYRITASGP